MGSGMTSSPRRALDRLAAAQPGPDQVEFCLLCGLPVMPTMSYEYAAGLRQRCQHVGIIPAQPRLASGFLQVRG